MSTDTRPARPWPDTVAETVTAMRGTLEAAGFAAVEVRWDPTFPTGASPATWHAEALAGEEMVDASATSAEAGGHREAARLALVRLYGAGLRLTGQTAHVEAWRWPGVSRSKACEAAHALLAEAGLPERAVYFHPGRRGILSHRADPGCWCRPVPVLPRSATRRAGE